MWPEVSNRGARLCLEAAFNLCTLDLPKPGEEYLFAESDKGKVSLANLGELRTYRDGLRAKLRASSLAQCLPAGLELLPVPEETLPAWALPVYKVYRPRDYRQLIDHLGDYLPDYLRLGISAGSGRFIVQRRIVNFVGTLAVIALYFGLRFGPALSGGPQLPHLKYVLLALVPLLGVLAYLALEPRRNDWRRQIHLAELYYFIRETYADSGDCVIGSEGIDGLLDPQRAKANLALRQ